MKPRVFISQSKVDKRFIEGIANDPRSARVPLADCFLCVLRTP
jgi:hypothetical protein